MDHISIGTLVLFPAAAVLAPLLARGVGRIVAIPLVVFEIVLGLLLGPAVLGWIQPDAFTATLSQLGLAMLFFLAGNEIDFRVVRGRPLTRAGIAWLVSLAAGVGVAALVVRDAPALAYVGIALSSTALGTVMPVLRDAGELRTPFGIAIVAIGAVGEFGPLLAISLFLSGRSPLTAGLVLLAFAILAGLAIWIARRGAGPRLRGVVSATLHTSGQFAVRLVLFVLLSLVALSVVLDLDMLLGAFAAGALYRALMAGTSEHDAEIVEGKLEAIGYGFLVPVFFIGTGVTFDMASLTADPATLALVPVFAVLLLATRGIPSWLTPARPATGRARTATALFGATGLPIIVAVTAIGVGDGELDSGVAAALVGAGMLSVLLFPLLGLAVRRRERARHGVAPARPDDVDVPVEG